jgi:hypothetical protein
MESVCIDFLITTPVEGAVSVPKRYPEEFRRKVLDLVPAGRLVAEVAILKRARELLRELRRTIAAAVAGAEGPPQPGRGTDGPRRDQGAAG